MPRTPVEDFNQGVTRKVKLLSIANRILVLITQTQLESLWDDLFVLCVFPEGEGLQDALA